MPVFRYAIGNCSKAFIIYAGSFEEVQVLNSIDPELPIIDLREHISDGSKNLKEHINAFKGSLEAVLKKGEVALGCKTGCSRAGTVLAMLVGTLAKCLGCDVEKKVREALSTFFEARKCGPKGAQLSIIEITVRALKGLEGSCEEVGEELIRRLEIMSDALPHLKTIV